MNPDQVVQNGLPKGWAACSVGQVTLPVSKIDPKKSPDREIDYIDISSIDNARQIIGDVKRYRLKEAPSRARQIVRSGDVLFATVRPYLRNIASVPKHHDRQIASTGFSVLRPATGISPAFLYYKAISRDFVNALSGIQYGVSYPAVKDKQVRDQPLWLPPLAEQRRIVAKIEKLFSELDKGLDSLKTARAQLKVYRQAVLKDAFEGKLTAQWREEKKDTLETLEQLFARIKYEREARYQRQLDQWKAALTEWEDLGKLGIKPRRPKKPQKLAEMPNHVSAKLPRLPEGWFWVRLGEISDVTGGLTKNQKRNSLARQMKYLRVANVYADKILTDDIRKIGVTDAEAKAVALEVGDLLIVEGNGSIKQIGRVALWDGELTHCGHQNHLIRTRLLNGFLPRFVLQFLLSPLGRNLIVKQASSTSGLHTLSISKVSNLIVPVTRWAEESEVVDEIEERLSYAERALDEIDTQLKRSNMLRQSILKKAFTGQLVLQDPNDEPASVLLDRISVERERLAKKAAPKKMRVSA